MLRIREMAFLCFKFQNFSGGVHPQTPPPIHAWYVGYTRDLQPMPLLSLYNILSHRKVHFQKIPPPHGKILKKGPASPYDLTSGGVRTTLRGIMGSRISCFERRWRHFSENMVSLDVYSRYVSLIFILLIKLLIKFNSYSVNYCILFIVFGEREYKTSCTRAACYYDI